MSEEQQEKRKVGRPTDYCEEIAKEICDTIACTPKGIIRLCKENPHWPKHETIYRWKRIHSEFSEQYTQAKRDQIEILVDQSLEIADSTENDTIEDFRGDLVENREWINRDRLRVDLRKWMAGKLAPKIYGEKIVAEHTGKDGKPIETVVHNFVAIVPAEAKSIEEWASSNLATPAGPTDENDNLPSS